MVISFHGYGLGDVMCLRKNLLLICLLVFSGLFSIASHAEVLGKLSASGAIGISNNNAKQNVEDVQTPYLSGDLVTTNSNSSAKLLSSDGRYSIVIAPDSVVSVSETSKVNVYIHKGSVSVDSLYGSDINLISATGTLRVASQTNMSVIVVLKDGELGILSKAGDLVVESVSGDAFHTVQEGAGAVFSKTGDLEVIEVLEGENGILIALLAAAAVIAGIIIIADDNDSTDPGPASPAG